MTFFVTSFPKKRHILAPPVQNFLNVKKCDDSAGTETCFSLPVSDLSLISKREAGRPFGLRPTLKQDFLFPSQVCHISRKREAGRPFGLNDLFVFGSFSSFFLRQQTVRSWTVYLHGLRSPLQSTFGLPSSASNLRLGTPITYVDESLTPGEIGRDQEDCGRKRPVYFASHASRGQNHLD